MANKLRGEVPITLGEHKLALRPTMDAIANIEEQFGGLPDICERIRTGKWRMMEIIAIVQVLVRGQNMEARTIPQAIADAGAASVANVVHLCLLAAFTGTSVDEMLNAGEESEGNALAPEGATS